METMKLIEILVDIGGFNGNYDIDRDIGGYWWWRRRGDINRRSARDNKANNLFLLIFQISRPSFLKLNWNTNQLKSLSKRRTLQVMISLFRTRESPIQLKTSLSLNRSIESLLEKEMVMFIFYELEARLIFPETDGQNKHNLTGNFVCTNINWNFKLKSITCQFSIHINSKVLESVYKLEPSSFDFLEICYNFEAWVAVQFFRYRLQNQIQCKSGVKLHQWRDHKSKIIRDLFKSLQRAGS